MKNSKNLNSVFDALILKKMKEDECNNTKSDLNNVLNNYINLCEKYVYHKTGYIVKAYNRDFPFDEIVDQIDGGIQQRGIVFCIVVSIHCFAVDLVEAPGNHILPSIG